MRLTRAAVVVSAAYIANALWGGHLAIRHSLPEAPFGTRSTRSVRADFYGGFGTALSPGLPMLIALAGVLYSVGQLSEPEALRVLRHPRQAPGERLAVVVGNVVLPALVSVASIRSLR